MNTIKPLYLLMLLAIMGNTNTIASETTILGDWCAGSENAFHEEFSLTIEDNDNIFASWLHHRPDESGKWTLKDHTLIIHTSSGHKYIYIIEKATTKQLVLHQEGYEPEIYVREGCFFVQLPQE